MNKTASKAIVSALIARDPEIRERGFGKALAALTDSVYFAELARSFLPDAYKVDAQESEVMIFEVADTHPIRPAKAEKISELSDELDDIGWSLRVVVVDYTGGVIADVPGFAYFPVYTNVFAPPNCLDMTPAALAVMRDREEPHAPLTPEQWREVMARIP